LNVYCDLWNERVYYRPGVEVVETRGVERKNEVEREERERMR
jgi:hypothetical protein